MKFFFGTTFYSALIFKKAPGTASSLFTACVLGVMGEQSLFFYAFIIVLLVSLHIYSFNSFVGKFDDEDPGIYTLDEAIAVSMLFAYSSEITYMIFAFIGFRFFDITKPLGIRSVENSSWPPLLKNLADDLLAALYTFLMVIVIEYAIKEW
jgi:phosphatidylglycerophosphatase A